LIRRQADIYARRCFHHPTPPPHPTPGRA
jgi:hypothetical protein